MSAGGRWFEPIRGAEHDPVVVLTYGYWRDAKFSGNAVNRSPWHEYDRGAPGG
jgi:hypothetical protein